MTGSRFDFLIAGVDEGVQGKVISIRSGDLFFYKGAQDPALDFVQEDVHGVDDTTVRESKRMHRHTTANLS